jgi:hypothetical protein
MADSYILFDLPPGVEPVDRAFLEDLGHQVEVCHGPPHGTICPILTDAGCPLAEGADGIVYELDLDRPQHRAILQRYKRALRSDIPIRVVVRPEQVGRYRESIAGLHVWTGTPVAGGLDAVAAEVESNHR